MAAEEGTESVAKTVSSGPSSFEFRVQSFETTVKLETRNTKHETLNSKLVGPLPTELRAGCGRVLR